MKVAIVTIYDYFNHGNRLQNYALEQTLINMGHEVETLSIAPKKSYPFFFAMAKCFSFLPMCARTTASMKFSKNSLHERKIDTFSNEELKKLSNEYDCFIIGSDQVWNPCYIANRQVSMLLFAPSEKCMSYAPSFGVSKLEDKYLSYFKQGLEHIKYLSIREKDGQNIIKELIGKESDIVLDPTLLLTKQNWENFAQKVKEPPKEDYLLTYFLGEPKEYKRKVQEIAEKNNLKVVNINRSTDKFYKSNPQEFIGLMQGAKLICTNSFHGHALSIALEKPFVSFASLKNTTSRIHNLLSKTNLENRNYKILEDKDIFEIDFSQTRQILEQEREKSLKFLKQALEKIGKGENESDKNSR